MFSTNNLTDLMQKTMQEIEQNGWSTLYIESEALKTFTEDFDAAEQNQKLKPAAITTELNNKVSSKANSEVTNKVSSEIRNDQTYWLEFDTQNMTQTEIILQKNISILIQHLRDYFRIAVKNFECHIAMYPAGHFYKTHIDQTSKNNHRFFSFVIYLNPEWSDANGGHIIGYKNDNEILFKISPLAGKMVIFKSDIPHEVAICNKTRRSITGWIRT